MGGDAEPLFYEEQSLRNRRQLILTAIPPLMLSLITVWQAALGQTWGKVPMSNGSLVFWTVFLWLIYLRLVTVKLVTEVRRDEISVKMRGLWRSYSIQLSSVKTARAVEFDPAREWGGYGVRSCNRGRAFLARGTRGAELELTKGGIVLIGSQRPEQLAERIQARISQPSA